MTLQQWVELGTTRLASGPHPERARRDAEALLQFLLRKERAALLARWKEKLEAAEGRRYLELIHRRSLGEPLQYITGETEFYGLPFAVSPAVLISRPETEHLVEHALELAKHFAAPRILDVGTGSGAIAVSLAHLLPQATVTTIDISLPALEVARKNARQNHVADRIRFLHGDLLQPIAGESFELILSNPPYVPTVDKPTLSVEVRDYEPELALFAGEDGFDLYRRLVPAAHAALIPGGFLAMEIGYGQQSAMETLLSESRFSSIAFLPDLQGIPRVASACRAS